MFKYSKPYQNTCTKLNLRKFLLENKEMPTQVEMTQCLGEPLATVIQSTFSPFSKLLMRIEPDKTDIQLMKKPIKIDKLVPKKCNHEVILELGELMLQRIAKRDQSYIENALLRAQNMMKTEFCNQLHDAIHEEESHYIQILDMRLEKIIRNFKIKSAELENEFERKISIYKEIIHDVMMKKIKEALKRIEEERMVMSEESEVEEELT